MVRETRLVPEMFTLPLFVCEGEGVRREVEATAGPHPRLWVLVTIEEAYIHCAKHIPRLAKLEKPIDWGTDNCDKKGGDYFHVNE